jgi:hypothetical protein
MALIQQTTVDIVGETQTIVFNNPSQVDQIQYINNQITFGISTTYNLSKSDLLLYGQFINTFNNSLILNFPSVNKSIGIAWPLCNFDFTESNVGTKKLIYNQSSSGTTVIIITYVPIANAASFATRASPVTITLQEYFMFVLMLGQYIQQVNLN